MSRSGKIWTLVYPLFNRTGGIERFLCDLTENLEKQNFQHKIACHKVEVLTHQNIEHVPTVTKPLFLRTLLFCIFGTLKVSRREHFIHTQGANHLNPDIITVHSCHKAWFLESLSELRPFSFRWLRKLLNPQHYVSIAIETWQYQFSNVRKIVCVSDIVKEQVKKHFKLRTDNLVTVHNGVNTEEFYPATQKEKRNLRQKLHWPSDERKVVLFVSHEFHRKNLTVVLRALSSQKTHFRLVVIGRDNPTPYIRDMSTLGLDRNDVTFLGARSDLSDLYRASDLFVLPTSHDAFALVVLEAMACGLPSITTKEAGVSEIIDHGSDGYVMQDPSSSEELEGFLREALRSESRISEGALKKAQSYSWKLVSQRMVQIYEELN